MEDNQLALSDTLSSKLIAAFTPEEILQLSKRFKVAHNMHSEYWNKRIQAQLVLTTSINTEDDLSEVGNNEYLYYSAQGDDYIVPVNFDSFEEAKSFLTYLTGGW